MAKHQGWGRSKVICHLRQSNWGRAQYGTVPETCEESHYKWSDLTSTWVQRPLFKVSVKLMKPSQTMITPLPCGGPGRWEDPSRDILLEAVPPTVGDFSITRLGILRGPMVIWHLDGHLFCWPRESLNVLRSLDHPGRNMNMGYATISMPNQWIEYGPLSSNMLKQIHLGPRQASPSKGLLPACGFCRHFMTI